MIVTGTVMSFGLSRVGTGLAGRELRGDLHSDPIPGSCLAQRQLTLLFESPPNQTGCKIVVESSKATNKAAWRALQPELFLPPHNRAAASRFPGTKLTAFEEGESRQPR